MTGKSPQERYETAKPSYLRSNEKQFADLPAGSSIVIPSPTDIETAITEHATQGPIEFGELRNHLAERFDADGACPVMTGMHLRIVAEVVLDALDAGVPLDSVSPFWNVVDPKSPLAGKLPGGPERIRELRDSELGDSSGG